MQQRAGGGEHVFVCGLAESRPSFELKFIMTSKKTRREELVVRSLSFFSWTWRLKRRSSIVVDVIDFVFGLLICI